MAEFCNQCGADYFGPNAGDFKGMSTPEQTAQGLYPVVLCEGCGPTQVDHTGNCVATDCMCKHGLEKQENRNGS